LLENGAKYLVIEVVVLDSFDDCFQVEGKFELSLDDLHQSTLVDVSGLVRLPPESNKSVHCITFNLQYSFSSGIYPR
jgi:hypothetical protein